jgi:hypothetical protein
MSEEGAKRLFDEGIQAAKQGDPSTTTALHLLGYSLGLQSARHCLYLSGWISAGQSGWF